MPAEDWSAEALRVTAFPSQGSQPSASGWWNDILGRPGETQTSKASKGEYLEEGPFESGKLTLKVHPNRIDWFFAPATEEREDDQTWPIIGTFLRSLQAFQQPMILWLNHQTCPPIQRFAFGAVLIQPVDGRSAGYEILRQYLTHVRLDPEGSSDFSYQINRPIPSTSGITGLQINRLTKWSVASRRLLTVEPRTMVSRTLQEQFATRLELDINTAQEFEGQLTADIRPRILNELIDLGREFSNSGETP